jgi:hypothetical protein
VKSKTDPQNAPTKRNTINQKYANLASIVEVEFDGDEDDEGDDDDWGL